MENENKKLKRNSRRLTHGFVVGLLHGEKYFKTALAKINEQRFRKHRRKLAFELTNVERELRISETNIFKYIPAGVSFDKANVWSRSLSSMIVIVMFLFCSCATVFGGAKTAHQDQKPRCGEPAREIRIGYFILDLVLFSPGLIVDFATGKIYKPEPGIKYKGCKEVTND